MQTTAPNWSKLLFTGVSEIDYGKVYIMSEILVKSRESPEISKTVRIRIEESLKLLTHDTSYRCMASYFFILLHLPVFFDSMTHYLFKKVFAVIKKAPRKVQHRLRELFKSVTTTDSVKLVVPQLKIFLRSQLASNPGVNLDYATASDTDGNGAMIQNFELVCWLLQLVYTSSDSVVKQYPDIDTKLFPCDFIKDELLVEHYNSWITRGRTSDTEFSICDFSFLISSVEKRKLLTKVSEGEMISIAESYFKEQVQKATKKQRQKNKEIQIDIGQIFLEIKVRRDHLLTDSLKAIKENRENLHRKLKIEFDNEQGIDLGGLTKEWFMLVIKELTECDESKGQRSIFTTNEERMFYWFNGSNKNLERYYLFGCLVGLAIHNSTILDVNLPLFYFKKLLSPAVYQTNAVAMEKSAVGSIEVSLEYLRDFQPVVMKSLQELLEYSGNVEEDFGLDFTTRLVGANCT